MASWLDGSHHKVIFGTDFLLNSLLFLHVFDGVFDLIKIKVHFFRIFTFSSFGTLSCVSDQLLRACEAVMTNLDVESLFDVELDCFAIELAVCVVNFDNCLSALIWQIHILLEMGGQLGSSLAHTTPGLNFVSVCLACIGNERYGRLSDSNDLLYFHVVVAVMGMQFCFKVVLDLCFRMCSVVFVFVVERRWQSMGECETEGNLVVARTEDTVWHHEDCVFVLEELFVFLHFLVSLMVNSFFTSSFALLPISDKADFLNSSEFEFNSLSVEMISNLKVNDTVDSCAWFVEWEFSLNHKFTFAEVTTVVTE